MINEPSAGRSPANPDNTRLLELLDLYWKAKGTGQTYRDVVLELLNGNSFLMFPSKTELQASPEEQNRIENGATLEIASLYNLDGLKVLGVFTDEQALYRWKKEACKYIAMRSADVLKLCEANQVARVVINSGQDNMFILEHGNNNVKEYKIGENSRILAGVPYRPPDPVITGRLVDSFRKLAAIEEVYLYGQAKDGEFSLVLAFKIDPVSENAKKAVINAVHDAVADRGPDQPLDILFMDTQELYDIAKGVSNSLIYKKTELT